MTKIIHCADLHLDSPMETHMTEEQASIRNTEIIHTFLRLTEYAAKNDVRAVIIAGDMFDGERIKIRTVDEILDAIRRTPNVDYLYLAGNHDGATYAFADHDMPDNLQIFGKEWINMIAWRYLELRFVKQTHSPFICRFHMKMVWSISLLCMDR